WQVDLVAEVLGVVARELKIVRADVVVRVERDDAVVDALRLRDERRLAGRRGLRRRWWRLLCPQGGSRGQSSPDGECGRRHEGSVSHGRSWAQDDSPDLRGTHSVPPCARITSRAPVET